MQKHENVHFRNQTVLMSGQDFRRCTFEVCELVFDATAPFRMGEGCRVIDCSVRLAGCAAAGVAVLQDLYHGGFRKYADLILADLQATPRSTRLPPQNPESN
jgi:hypothetical protein